MNYTADDLNADITNVLFFNTGLLLLYLVLGLTGNAVVLYIYTCRMRRTEERYFIPILAVADILACLAGVTLGVVSNFYRAHYTLDTFCKVGYFLTWMTTSISGIIILLIALNRHLMICRPLGPQLTVARKRRALVVIVIFSIVSSGPMLYFLGERRFAFMYKGQLVNATLCTLRFSDGLLYNLQFSYFMIEIFLALLNMVITCGLYIPVGVKIYQKFKQSNRKGSFGRRTKQVSTAQSGYPSTSNNTGKIYIEESEYEESVFSTTMSTVANLSNSTSLCSKCKSNPKKDNKDDTSVNRKKRVKRKQVRHNFTMMFATIIIVYILAYLPTLVLMMLPGNNPAHFWFSRDPITLNFLVFLQRSFLLNNILNAFVYSYFDVSFRKEVKKIICCFRGF